MVMLYRLLAVLLSFLLFASVSAKALEDAGGDPGQVKEATHASPPHGELMRFLLQQVQDPNQLRGYRIAILAADGVDGFDLEVPRNFLAERGATVHVIVPRPLHVLQSSGSGAVIGHKTEITVLNPSGEEDTSSFDRYLDEIRAADYDVVYLPGRGVPSGGLIEENAIGFLHDAARAEKPIFAIGDSPLVLLKAGLLDHKRATGDAATQSKLASSNATAADAPLVKDGIIHTSRNAFDMPALMDRLIAALLAQPANQHQ